MSQRQDCVRTHNASAARPDSFDRNEAADRIEYRTHAFVNHLPVQIAEPRRCPRATKNERGKSQSVQFGIELRSMFDIRERDECHAAAGTEMSTSGRKLAEHSG